MLVISPASFLSGSFNKTSWFKIMPAGSLSTTLRTELWTWNKTQHCVVDKGPGKCVLLFENKIIPSNPFLPPPSPPRLLNITLLLDYHLPFRVYVFLMSTTERQRGEKHSKILKRNMSACVKKAWPDGIQLKTDFTIVVGQLRKWVVALTLYTPEIGARFMTALKKNQF